MADGMENKHMDSEKNRNDRSWLGIIVRFVAAIVLMITSLITHFSNMGFGTALLAAIVIAVIDYLIQKLFKIDASPFAGVL